MKKHIKKVLCAVALIVLCVSAFVFPSFATAVEPGANTTSSPLPYVNAVYYDVDADTWVTNIDIAMPIEPLSASEYDDSSTLFSIIRNQGNVEYHFNREVIDFADPYNMQSVELSIPATRLYNVENTAAYQDLTYVYLPISDFGNYTIAYSYTVYTQSGNYSYDVDIGSSAGGYIRPYADACTTADVEHPGWDYIIVGEVYISGITINQWFYFSVPYDNDANEYFDTFSTAPYMPPTYISDVPIGEFLWDSINNFLSFELFPNVTLYHLFTAIIAIPLFIWFLKLFAGG